MTSTPVPVKWSVDPQHLLAAIEWSCKKLRHSIDRPQMNRRGLSESLDDKIMGDVATVAVVEYLRHIDVRAVAYDQIRRDQFRDWDPGWDVAFGQGTTEWAKQPDDPKAPDPCLYTASVRSSRLPRNDSLDYAVKNRDFKIFAPHNSSISNCITADVEIQVYYDYRRTQLGELQITDEMVTACIEGRPRCAQISAELKIGERYGTCFLTAWNFKDAIVEHSGTLKDPCWDSFGKRMWFAPLRLGRSMPDLANYGSGKCS